MPPSYTIPPACYDAHSLSENHNLGDEGVRAIAEALRNNATLTSLKYEPLCPY